jgi:hypothetical protein
LSRPWRIQNVSGGRLERFRASFADLMGRTGNGADMTEMVMLENVALEYQTGSGSPANGRVESS